MKLYSNIACLQKQYFAETTRSGKLMLIVVERSERTLKFTKNILKTRVTEDFYVEHAQFRRQSKL